MTEFAEDVEFFEGTFVRFISTVSGIMQDTIQGRKLAIKAPFASMALRCTKGGKCSDRTSMISRTSVDREGQI
jgi:hypothetical protein